MGFVVIPLTTPSHFIGFTGKDFFTAPFVPADFLSFSRNSLRTRLRAAPVSSVALNWRSPIPMRTTQCIPGFSATGTCGSSQYTASLAARLSSSSSSLTETSRQTRAADGRSGVTSESRSNPNT